MKEYGKEFDVCPHCGYIAGTLPQNKSHLRGGTELCGRYMVGKVLGYGGFGITYIAWDQKLKRTVAIKEFFPNSLSTRSEGESSVSCYDSKALRFFNDGIKKMLDEGSRLSKFSGNENIVNVYDCFEENNTAYIVMEYLEGKDLKQYLAENGGKLSPEKAVEIILPVLNALEDMHKEKIIHRDIAPDNIFLCGNGKIKLLDFGSARLAVEDSEKSLSVMVKRGYAPKEQYASRSKQGPWTDVYAVCATLYKMITGSLPSESMERDIAPLESFSEFGINGFDELEKVIFKGLEPEISDRIRSVPELVKLLSASISSKKEPEEATIPKETSIAKRIGKNNEDFDEVDEKDEDELTLSERKFVIRERIWANKKRIAAIGCLFMILVGVIISICIHNGFFEQTTEGKQKIVVDSFVGLNYYDDIITNEEFKEKYIFTITRHKNETSPVGTVSFQNPEQGMAIVVKKGEKINVELDISSLSKDVIIPNVVGKNCSEAVALLEAEGVKRIIVLPKEAIELDFFVASVKPGENTEVDSDSEITLICTEEEPKNIIPDIIGKAYSEAERILKSKGFKVRLESQLSFEEPGKVIEVSPKVNTKAAYGTEVTIYYASDQNLVIVPNCVGWDIETAKALLESKGLTVSEVKEVNSNEHVGQVIEQTPEAKQKVLPNSEVVLTVSNGIPEESEAEIEFTLPSSDDRGTISIYIDNSLYETKTVLFDGSKYTAKIVGSGEDAVVKIVADNKIYFTCTVDFTKSPAVVTDKHYPSTIANLKLPDVKNMKQADAVNMLVTAGFSRNNIKIVEKSTDDPDKDGIVLEQTPQASTNSLLPGIVNYYPASQEITLTVGKY